MEHTAGNANPTDPTSATANPEQNQDCLAASGEAVIDLCRKLASLNYYKDAACTELATLRPAIKDFQKMQMRGKHPADGICDMATWQAITASAGASFAEIWQAELDALHPDTGDTSQEPLRPAEYEAVCQRAHHNNLAGLAFSGGGIRSATFNLGFLQALAELKLLHQIDYLSTVSGGGYIGGWLSKWIQENDGKVEAVEQQLPPGSPDKPIKHEAHEIKFLRQYSNYLTPQTGFFSADSWSMLATWLRNAALNLCILVSVLASIMIFPHMLVQVVRLFHASHANYFAGAALLCLMFAVFCMALHISVQPGKSLVAQANQRNVILMIVLPLMFAAACGSVALWENRKSLEVIWMALNPHKIIAEESVFEVAPLLLIPGFLYFLCWTAGWTCAQYLNARQNAGHAAHTNENKSKLLQLREALGHFLAAEAALAIGTLMLLACSRMLQRNFGNNAADQDFHLVHLLGAGIPLLFFIFGCTMVLQVGLIGRLYSEQSREWWSRLGGWMAILLLSWLGLFFMTFYAPPIFSWLHHKYEGWLSGAIGSGWLLTTVTGLLAAYSESTNGKEKRNLKLELIAACAPYVFSLGILGLVATMLHFILNPGHIDHPLQGDKPAFFSYLEYYLGYASTTHKVNLWVALLGFSGIAMLLAWRLDINKFSLYMMSCNRVVRAYLGASSRQRKPHPFTGFDPHDDPRLETLAHGKQGSAVQRPYHLLNTSLNLTGGKELAWQNRKAANFLFSPLFCGYELPANYHNAAQMGQQLAEQGCFRPTAQYGSQGDGGSKQEQGTRLGMAVTISGAAVSPAMGYHSSPPLAFLMTLFNLRLGRWCANPRKAKWRRSGPEIGLFCLLSELFGKADADANYVYLSDGGHFENLGLYELVRRRCRLIIVVDASADGKLCFDDLGNAIRKCYTDLAVEIELDVSAIELKDELSTAHCVTGLIHYEKVDQMKNAQSTSPGILLYVKPSLTGKEMADILNYRKTEQGFPHQSTADQWFDETQFESYRALGYRIGRIALELAVNKTRLVMGKEDIEQLSMHLMEQWGQADVVVTSEKSP